MKQSAFCLAVLCGEAVGSKAPKEKLQDCVGKERKELSRLGPCQTPGGRPGLFTGWGVKREGGAGTGCLSPFHSLRVWSLRLVAPLRCGSWGVMVELCVGGWQSISLHQCPAGWLPKLGDKSPRLAVTS